MEANQRKVVKVVRHTPGIFELWLERGDLTFVPGDCVALYAADQQASRPYSVASGVDEPVLRFLIREMAGGEVSPFLAARQPGDWVKVSPPFGWFRPGQDREAAPFIFMGTGTGIAPCLALLHSWPERTPVCCLYGVRTRADAVAFYWLRERIDVRLAVSREPASDAVYGRITDLLEAMPVPEGAHYYLCGLDAMIDEVSQWLEARQVPLPHIHRECFFNAPAEPSH